MTNVLKKITIGNPLANFHLWDDLEEHNKIKTPEELANFYHKMLTKHKDRPLVCRFLYGMIGFSVSSNVNSLPESL